MEKFWLGAAAANWTGCGCGAVCDAGGVMAGCCIAAGCITGCGSGAAGCTGDGSSGADWLTAGWLGAVAAGAGAAAAGATGAGVSGTAGSALMSACGWLLGAPAAWGGVTGSDASTGAPQFIQNLESLGISFPHFIQNIKSLISHLGIFNPDTRNYEVYIRPLCTYYA